MNFNPCDYSDIFGKPGEGAHSYRMFNIAGVDLGLTFLAAFLFYKYNPKYSLLTYFTMLILIAIISHRIFCVNTTINKFIFGKV